MTKNLETYNTMYKKYINHFSIKELKNEINKHLEKNTLNNYYVETLFYILSYHERAILRKAHLKTYDREINFLGFKNTKIMVGGCVQDNNTFADIQLTDRLLIKNNGEAILNVIAHEVLHAILPGEPSHKEPFKTAMKKINEKLPVKIVIIQKNPQVKNIPYKYEVYCPKCHKVLKRYFKESKYTKTPEKYRHKTCNTILKCRKLEPTQKEKAI